MGLTNVTGESIYSGSTFYVDAETAVSKIFIISNSLYPNSMNIAWNGLVVSPHAFKVQRNSIIFNADFPLKEGDEIYAEYTLGD